MEIELPVKDVVQGMFLAKGIDMQVRDQWSEQFKQAQDALITQDERMLLMKQAMAIAADAVFHPELHKQVTSMILGETGTGKELCAKILHGKRQGPCLAVNCSAIPDGLFEAELFGYKRGAFTGANVNTKGKFVAAQNGTVFLDEVGDLPLVQQAKLLRAIETREVTPLGENMPVPFNCQIISATNKNILEMVKFNQFRADLLFRLNILTFTTVPLRDRPKDVALILRAFRQRYSLTQDDSLPDQAVYAEGNVRALIAWAIRYEIGYE